MDSTSIFALKLIINHFIQIDFSCGTGASYCGGYVVQPTVTVSNCRVTGCAAGSCCSSYG